MKLFIIYISNDEVEFTLNKQTLQVNIENGFDISIYL